MQDAGLALGGAAIAGEVFVSVNRTTNMMSLVKWLVISCVFLFIQNFSFAEDSSLRDLHASGARICTRYPDRIKDYLLTLAQRLKIISSPKASPLSHDGVGSILNAIAFKEGSVRTASDKEFFKLYKDENQFAA